MKVSLLAFALAVACSASSLAAPPDSRRLVTLKVKDAEAVDVIRSLQKQCGVKNVVIDKDVSGRASFFFTDVPCGIAWTVVLRTYGLDSSSTQPVMHVETRR